jgi:type IV pilus assembly protein PilA
MATSAPRPKRLSGFTLLELMIVVTIIGALAAVAIPQFLNYKLRSKTAEVRLNLAAIRTLEITHFSATDVYVTVDPEPPVIPGASPVAFNPASGFDPLGFIPEGLVSFSYGVAVSPDGTGFTADAGADLDGDGFVQFWGLAKPDGAGVLAPGRVGCDAAGLVAEQLGPCSPGHGASIF